MDKPISETNERWRGTLPELFDTIRGFLSAAALKRGETSFESYEDVIEQSRYPWMADRLPPLWYGEGVKFTITWLLGDWTAPPVDRLVEVAEAALRGNWTLLDGVDARR